jgi:hypothetical protein
LGVAQHAGGVHAFALPQIHEALAPAVAAQTAQVGQASPGPCCGNGGVAGVAAKALQVQRSFMGLLAWGLVELDHGFAEGNDVEGFGDSGHVKSIGQCVMHGGRISAKLARR